MTTPISKHAQEAAHEIGNLFDDIDQKECKCASIDSEFGCPRCDAWTSAEFKVSKFIQSAISASTEELRKELEDAKTSLHQSEFGKYGRIELQQQLSTAKEVIERLVGANQRAADGLTMSLNNQGGISGTERFPRPIWTEIKSTREHVTEALAFAREKGYGRSEV